MDANLRDYFDRAVSDDPGADPGEMAHAAIAQGGRVRRRRRQMAVAGVTAGLVTALAVVAGVNAQPDTPRSARPPVTLAAAMMPIAAPACSATPVDRDATDAVIFLSNGVSTGQLSALRSSLSSDARVKALLFEDRAQAYQRFRVLWADNPDFVAAVGADALPESFRLRLVHASQYKAFRADYAAMAGVEQIHGRVCPTSAPVGGVL